MSDARSIMAGVMNRFGRPRNPRKRVAAAVVELVKLAPQHLTDNHQARDVFAEIARKLSVHGPWSTTVEKMSDAEIDEMAAMIRKLDALVVS